MENSTALDILDTRASVVEQIACGAPAKLKDFAEAIGLTRKELLGVLSDAAVTKNIQSIIRSRAMLLLQSEEITDKLFNIITLGKDRDALAAIDTLNRLAFDQKSLVSVKVGFENLRLRSELKHVNNSPLAGLTDIDHGAIDAEIGEGSDD